jgi:hypothetical protein
MTTEEQALRNPRQTFDERTVMKLPLEERGRERGAIGKALIVYLLSGSVGLALVVLLAFGAIGC